MYLPSYFEETRVEVLHQLMRERPLATLVTLGAAGLNANHLPFDSTRAAAQRHAALSCRPGHPVWRDYSLGTEALVIFHGPQVYISPSWYETKKQSGEVVPTYNYAVVHAYGALRIIQERAWLRGLVTRLTERFESASAAPWQVSDAPEDFIDKQLGAIVGIEITITRLAGKWKVSQNRPALDRVGVVEALSETAGADSLAIAQMIKERSSSSS